MTSCAGRREARPARGHPGGLDLQPHPVRVVPPVFAPPFAKLEMLNLSGREQPAVVLGSISADCPFEGVQWQTVKYNGGISLLCSAAQLPRGRAQHPHSVPLYQ
jgi:hypothetical protein